MMKKIMVPVLIVLLLLLVALFGTLLMKGDSLFEDQGTTAAVTEETAGAETVDFLMGRDPADFTWEEYQALTAEQQMQFPDYFESLDAFNSWYEAVDKEPEAPELSDFLNGRDPATFTWEEYQSLTAEEQMQFPDYFESLDAFDSWYDAVKQEPAQPEPQEPDVSDFLNGRDPASFTWAEYQALTAEQQMQFPDYFESLDAFESWRDKAQENDALPGLSDFLNGQDPASFTWAAYQSLTAEQQAMFPDYFESYDAFLAWKDRVAP